MSIFKRITSDPDGAGGTRRPIFRRTRDDDVARIKGEVEQLSSALERHEQRAAAERSVANDAGADDGLVARLDELAARVAALDDRVSAASRELANQVSELGNEIDALQRGPVDDGDANPGEGTLDELRDSQTRLANEQARYQIAFRNDLATLAEQLRLLDSKRDPRR